MRFLSAKTLHLLIAGVAFVGLTSGCGPQQPEIITEGQEAFATSAEAGAGEGWLTDYEQAKKQAGETNKLVLINFTGSDWCPPCIMLKRQVFSQPEFNEYAERNLVLLEIDFPRRKPQSKEQAFANQQLARRFGIDGFPTIVVLNATGKVVGQLGYMSGGPERFIGELEKLRAL
jgi:thioredoxin-related protein